jgi:hypothetical protein
MDQFVELLRQDPLLTLVNHNDLASARFESFFDVVSISHVLEHLTDPYEAMDLFASVLKPGGLLLIDIPNEVRMLQRGFQAKGHLSYFTKESFARFVDVHGCFDLMELRTCNREVDLSSRLYRAGGLFDSAGEGRHPIPRAAAQCRMQARQRRHWLRRSRAAQRIRRPGFFISTCCSPPPRGRVAQLEQELQRARRAAQGTVQGPRRRGGPEALATPPLRAPRLHRHVRTTSLHLARRLRPGEDRFIIAAARGARWRSLQCSRRSLLGRSTTSSTWLAPAGSLSDVRQRFGAARWSWRRIAIVVTIRRDGRYCATE